MNYDVMKKSILKTLAYFDIFGYALTAEELKRFRYGYTDNPDLQMCDLPTKDGFYYLPGREENVATRQKAVKLQEKKIKIAKRGIKIISWVPFLRAVFVCNTLSGPGLTEDSDIDVFIIARKGRLWLVRILATLSLRLFGLRTIGKKTKDRICLSFFAADDSLNLSKIAIENDVYLMYWLAQLIPIYDPENLLASIQRANQWVKEYLPNAFAPYELSKRWRVDSIGFSKFFKKLLEKMWCGGYGDLMEKQAREAQVARMKLNYMSKPGAGVVMSDQMLKFHENDRRAEYREKWRKNIQYLISNV